MTEACRSWWRNCAFQPDAEIRRIDAMEDDLAPVGPEMARVRELISSLEMCHHKAERWVENIFAAIGAGRRGIHGERAVRPVPETQGDHRVAQALASGRRDLVVLRMRVEAGALGGRLSRPGDPPEVGSSAGPGV
jgi:hypothetical protein